MNNMLEIFIVSISIFIPFVYWKQDTEVMNRHIKRGSIKVRKSTYYLVTATLILITIGLFNLDLIKETRLLQLVILPAFSMLTFFLSLISVCTFMEDTMNKVIKILRRRI